MVRANDEDKAVAADFLGLERGITHRAFDEAQIGDAVEYGLSNGLGIAGGELYFDPGIGLAEFDKARG